MERREFIASTMGMAVLDLAAGCAGKDGMMSNDIIDRMMDEKGARSPCASRSWTSAGVRAGTS